MDYDDYEQIFEFLESFDKTYNEIKEKLIEFEKYDQFKYEIIEAMEKYFEENKSKKKEFLSCPIEFIRDKRLNFKYNQIINLPNINPTISSSENYYNNYDKDEIKLRESVSKLEYFQKFKDVKIKWQSCYEIFGGKNLVILPDEINYSYKNQFNQGLIGDCYFISCVQALSRLPQLLNFILRLSTKDMDNQINFQKNKKNENNLEFKVNFFIDGEWKIIRVKDSFPLFLDLKDGKYKLVGVTPNNNELFLMILEKAWAIINGGYDKMESGYISNIFELFLGCKCDYFYNNHEKNNDYINSLYERIRINEKFFGTLSLCGSTYYKKNDEFKNIKEFQNQKMIYETHDKEDWLKKEYIIDAGGHAYNILKTYQLNIPNSMETCKFLIISNPHGEGDYIGSGIELKKIEEIIEKKLGKNNIDRYKYIIDKNKGEHHEKNEGEHHEKKEDKHQEFTNTGLIYMPLEYFKDWFDDASICYTHYDCLNYTLDINNELENLYIYKIKSNSEQLFTCQICFPSKRAHRNEIVELSVSLRIDEDEIKDKINILLFNYKCCIKIMKNNENFDTIENPYFSEDEDDDSSIKEIKTIINNGEYIIMIYMESSFNKCVARFLSQYEIEIILINKISKRELDKNFEIDKIRDLFENTDYDIYNKLINPKNVQNLIPLKYKANDFLPGMRKYYLHFEKLAKEKRLKDLKPEDAIFSISQEGNAYYYEIMDPGNMVKIFGREKKDGEDDFLHVETLQFRNNFGIPYKVKNVEELINEMKLNREPLSCLFSEYDENHKILTSGVIHFNIYENQAKNEDILVITDKSGNYIKRDQKPLLIILLDISGSMKEYHEILQNKIIPKLLQKLGYFGIKKIMPKIEKILKEKNIKIFELLMSWSSKIRYEKFIEKYELKDKMPEYDLLELKSLYQDLIVLITFSDDAEMKIYDPSDFVNCKLGWDTYFRGVTKYLNDIFNKISRERSIRMICFSDGEIHDTKKSLKNLDKLLNSKKTKPQMKSISVRVCHDKVEPDTKVLMKLSLFSNPICDMSPININLENTDEKIDEVVDQLCEYFENDGMIYNLKLFSSIIMLSNDFSINSFSHEQYIDKRNNVYRINGHRDQSFYKNLVKNNLLRLSSGKKIELNFCGKLNKRKFNNLTKKIAPYISQKILEEKVNKNRKKENQKIIEYFKKTEKALESKPTFSNFLENINNDNKINPMKPNQLYNKINQVKEEAKETINKNEADFLKEDKLYIKNKIKEVLQKKINKKKQKMKKKCLKKDGEIKNKKIINEIGNKKFANKIKQIPENQETRAPSKTTTFYNEEKESNDIKIGYHNITKFDEFQNQIIQCIKQEENILVSTNEIIGITIFLKTSKEIKEIARSKNKKIIYTCLNKLLINQKYNELKKLDDKIELFTGSKLKNNNAKIIVMTQEILKNIIFQRNELISKIYLIIFDDINFMENSENNTIFEEIILLLNNEIKFLFFSKPFYNIRQFGSWMIQLKNQPFNIINYNPRPIGNMSLKNYLFPDTNANNDKLLIFESGQLNKENENKYDLEELFYNENLNKAFDIIKNYNMINNKNIKNIYDKNSINMNLINVLKKFNINGLCPVVIICNSQKECKKNAENFSKYFYENKTSMNMEKKEKEKIQNLYKPYVNDKNKEKIKKFSEMILSGFGYYHNGMLPVLKKFAKTLFIEGLIKVLFTENFYCYPVEKTLVLISINKFNDIFFLDNEYSQIYEKEEKAIIILNNEIYLKIIKGKTPFLFSNFKPTFNLISNIIRMNQFKPEDILIKSFYQFQKDKKLIILKKKLEKLYNEYLSNNFNNELKEVEIQELLEIKDDLDELKNKIYKNFSPEFFSEFLDFGSVIKLKNFGYGIVINNNQKITNNENNSNKIIKYYLNKDEKEGIENLYFNSFYTNDDINHDIDNNGIISNSIKIIINKEYLRETKFLESAMQKTNSGNKQLNDNDENNNVEEDESDEKSNDNYEYTIDVLVSLNDYKDNPFFKDFLYPGNFEDKSFFGIFTFRISNIEEIYKIPEKIKLGSKVKNLVNEWGNWLNTAIKKYKNNFPIFDIINEYKKRYDINDLENPELEELLREYSEKKREYNKLKTYFIKKYIESISDDNFNNNEIRLNEEIEKYIKNNNLLEQIKVILAEIDKNENNQIFNMKNAMKLLKITDESGEKLTEKGNLCCDISDENALILTELIFSKFLNNKNKQDIGGILCYCLKKEKLEDEENEKIQSEININKLINKNRKMILKTVELVANVFEKCKIFCKEDEKNKYIESFNDDYLIFIYNLIDTNKFEQIIKYNENLYKENIINILRKIEELSKIFENSKEIENIGGSELKKKFKELKNKVNLVLQFIK